MSAASNTLAAVSSSGGLEDAHLVILTERPIHLLDSDSHRPHLGRPQAATRCVVSLAFWMPLSVNCTKLMYVGLIFSSVPEVSFDLDSSQLRDAHVWVFSETQSRSQKSKVPKINPVVSIFMRAIESGSSFSVNISLFRGTNNLDC